MADSISITDSLANSAADLDFNNQLGRRSTPRRAIGEQASSLTDVVGDEISINKSINTSTVGKTATSEGVDKASGLLTAKKSLVAIDAVADVVNAQNAYSSTSEANRINIFNSQMQAQQSVAQGFQQGLFARTQGIQAADTTLLNLAAQGQDVTSAASQKQARSFEAISIFNQMQEQINGVRQALGHEMKAIEYQRETNAAKFQRDMTFLSSAGKLGSSFV